MTAGDRYGYLTVIETLSNSEANRNGHGTWIRVRCDCGTRKTIARRQLREGQATSCGCKAPQSVRAATMARVAMRGLAR